MSWISEKSIMAEGSSLESTLVDALIRDRKADRRWRNIRFIVWVLILVTWMFYMMTPSQNKEKELPYPYVSMVRLSGIIMPGAHFSAQQTIPLLRQAFADKKAKGVLLVINSPGGSPVQASIIHDKILQLKALYHKKVVVVGLDTLASGSYLVASAADKIYVQPDTLTGSIGVIMSGFGFTDAIHKLGITRRVFTAGSNKDRLDPFLPQTPEDKAKLKNILRIVHRHFINDVLQGRKHKLHADPKELFSGDFWTGSQAVQLGLVDGTANTWQVMQHEFKVKHYRNYSRKFSFIQALLKDANEEVKLPFSWGAQQTRLSSTLQG